MKFSRIHEIFEGDDRSLSFGRVMGTGILSPIMAAYCWAAFAGKWDVVESMTPQLLFLVAGLYAIGKIGLGAQAIAASMSRRKESAK